MQNGGKSSANGIAGGAEAFSNSIKEQVITLQDKLLVGKYREHYENTVIHLDDLVNNLMLEQALKIDDKNPERGLMYMKIIYESKLALNSVMKFIDAS